MVEEGDEPFVCVLPQILFQPLQHRAAVRARRTHRVQAHEMDVAEFEGIVFLSAAGHSAGFGVCRECEILKVGGWRRSGRIPGLLVADRRPYWSLPQNVRIRIEYRDLPDTIAAPVISIVTEHQEKVCVPVARKIVISVANRQREHVRHSEIAEHPHAERPVRASRRRSAKEIIHTAGQRAARRSY